MARRTVRCGCGADFPIPEVPPSVLHCPRCGEAVRFRAAGDTGGQVQVKEDIREPLKPLPVRNPYYPLILLGAAGLVIAGGLVGLIIMFSGREAKRDPIFNEGVRAKPREKTEDPLISIRELPPLPDVTKTAPEPAKPATGPVFDSAAGLNRVQVLSSRMNLAGVVSTLYLLTQKPNEHRELLNLIAKDEAEMRQLALRLSDRPEFQTLKDHFQSGDVLTGFNGAALEASQSRAFTDTMRDWLSSAQPGATVLAVIQRDGKPILLPMWFPELPLDILPKDLRTAPAPPAPVVSPFPAETLNEVRRRTSALHPFYRKQLPAEDAVRLEALLKEGRGRTEDLDFLRSRILAYCARCESEHAGFDSKISLLENAIASTQAVDTVFMKDGRKMQGQITEETDEYVRLQGRFGAVKMPKAELLRVERGDSFGAEFRRRYDAARGKPADLPGLLSWCKEKNLAQQRELTAYVILKSDPGNDAAWTALGVADRTAPASGPDFDVVILKDGTRREGIITGETDAAVQLDVVVRGVKTETIGTGKASIPKTEIAKVERMSDAARKRARERANSFGERAQKSQEAMSRILLSPDTITGLPALRASGTLFELHSTLPAPQVRETANTLEEMFNAYRKHFAIRRNAARRIDVYFLANSTEYANFQQATRGAVALNPAYFDTRANHVAAFYGVQKDEEARLRGLIQNSEREIEQFKRQITAEEERITKEFRGLRQSVMDQASKARKAAGEDGKALAAVDRMKQEAFNNIKEQERGAMDYLTKLRTRANQSIADHEAVIRHNQAVLVSQTKAMYEILFHESFHAFAANFLWEEADNAGLPRWLHEGMATYFERSVVEAGELVHGGVHPNFLTLLKNQQQANQLSPVGSIVGAGAEIFQIQHTGEIPRQETAYAHAWGLAHYLMARGVTRDQLEAYVTDVSAGKNRVAAFEKLAGRKIGEIEAEWRVHINSLR